MHINAHTNNICRLKVTEKAGFSQFCCVLMSGSSLEDFFFPFFFGLPVAYGIPRLGVISESHL